MALVSLSSLAWSESEIARLREGSVLSERHLPDEAEVRRALDEVVGCDGDAEIGRLVDRAAPLPLIPGTLSPWEWDEFWRKAWIRSMLMFWPQTRRVFDAGDWPGLIEQVDCVFEVMPPVFELLYPTVPDEYKAELALTAFSDHGDRVKAVRDAVKALPRQGAATLPGEYADKDVITVYRAGRELLKEAPDALSWTLDEKVAEFFRRRRPSSFLYRAKLHTRDVIGFIANRNEAEVVQHGSVYGVELIAGL